MAIENPALLAVTALLAAAAIVLGLALLRRAPRVAPGPDPTVVFLQQEIGRLAGQVAQIGAQIPRDVGVSLQQITGQMSQRLSENARSLQKASADTGRLIADINHRLGELGRSSQEILALGQDIRGLQQIFQAPKIRGGLGEIALASLLQQIFPAEQFTLQHSFQDGQTVDAVLRMHRELGEEFGDLGCVIQSYLRRSEADGAALAASRARKSYPSTAPTISS